MVANDVQVYEKNTAITEAVGGGEIDFGLVEPLLPVPVPRRGPRLPRANGFFDGGDVGSLVNVAGAGILETTDQPSAAEEFIAFLLSDEAQEYFRSETFEYPLVQGIPADDRLPRSSPSREFDPGTSTLQGPAPHH
jgi:iron(III) transport system substrate-binding protein